LIDELTPGSTETVYWDDNVPGFGVKVTPQGRKVFIVLYRTKDGFSRLRKYTIGTHGQTTLAIRGLRHKGSWLTGMRGKIPQQLNATSAGQ
jgi:hypothetical protein